MSLTSACGRLEALLVLLLCLRSYLNVTNATHFFVQDNLISTSGAFVEEGTRVMKHLTYVYTWISFGACDRIDGTFMEPELLSANISTNVYMIINLFI